MTLPFPLPPLPVPPIPFSPFPFPFPRAPRTTPPPRPEADDGHVLGVSPVELEATSRSLIGNGVAIHAADAEAIGAVRGPSNAVTVALRNAAEPARSAIDAIGNRLVALGEALSAFSATTTADDARVASTIERFEER